MEFTMLSIEKPLVHRIRVPELMEVCITGKEKVNPNSLFLPGVGLNFCSSSLINLASFEAM